MSDAIRLERVTKRTYRIRISRFAGTQRRPHIAHHRDATLSAMTPSRFATGTLRNGIAWGRERPDKPSLGACCAHGRHPPEEPRSPERGSSLCSCNATNSGIEILRFAQNDKE
jgi:hypothetical protein